MHRLANHRVFFNEPHVVTGARETQRGVETCGTAAHHHHVALPIRHAHRVIGRNRNQCGRL